MAQAAYEKASDDLGIAEHLIYNEEERPNLFAYFFKGAPGHFLDNANGNVMCGIANGTLCRYDSIAWNDIVKTRAVLALVSSAIQQGESLVDLPFPPDLINVVVLDREGDPVSSKAWPASANLESTIYGEFPSDRVVIPIGTIASKADAYFIKLPNHDLKIHYRQHAVDLAMALTIWKAQGATFDRVILHLEVSANSRSWGFEHLYVALSRVRSVQHIRCPPLSLLFKRKELQGKRPDIHTVKWLLDLNSNGLWKRRDGKDSSSSEDDGNDGDNADGDEDCE